MRAFGLLTATIAAALSGIAYEAGGPLALFGGTAIVVVLIIVAGLLVIRAARRRPAPTDDPFDRLRSSEARSTHPDKPRMSHVNAR